MSLPGLRPGPAPRAALVGLLALAACGDERIPTVVDPSVPDAGVILLASETAAPENTQITLAIRVDVEGVTDRPLAAVQGMLSWDPASLRYVGEIVEGGSLLAVNAATADDGSLRLAVIDPTGLGNPVATLVFEVRQAGYATQLRFDTHVVADVDRVRIGARDLRGLRRADGLPPPSRATGASLAERLMALAPTDPSPTDLPPRVPGAADLFGDGNEDGRINVLDALYAANVAVGNDVLGPCVVGTAAPSRDCLAINVEPVNAPGLGESTDPCPPGVENSCADPALRIVDALDWLAITQEVVGDDHPVVGEAIPNARGGADRTSPGDTVILVDPPVVTGTLVFSTDTLYILASGELVVGDEGGAAGTVVFQPGVVFEGTDSTTGIRVTRNGRIVAEGTATEPITFSCRGGDPAPGCWRGIAVLGNAVVNADLTGQPAPTIPERNPSGGGNQIALDSEIVFGGSNDLDDSGTLRYVRILYAGARYERSPGDETLYAGLRVGACGSGTELDFIQSHASGRNGIEVLGGRCDLGHVISSQAGDDLFHMAWGYDGTVQYAVAVHDAGTDRAVDAVNTNDVATYDALPRTAPSFWNLTVVGGTPGSPVGRGLYWHRGAQGEVRNALLVETGIPIEVTDGSCARLPGNEGLLAFENLVVLGRGASLGVSADCPAALESYLSIAAIDDRAYAGELVDPFTGWLPDLRPVGSGVTSQTVSPATPPAPLDPATYFGATRPEEAGGVLPWYAGWFQPWEPLPSSLAGGGEYRIAASCLDRIGSAVACSLIIAGVPDTVDVGITGDTVALPENRDVFVTAFDSTTYWRSVQTVLNGRAGEIETVVFQLGKGGEYCGGEARSLDRVTVRPNSGCIRLGVVSTAEEAIFLIRDGGVVEFGRGEHRVIDQDVPRDGLTFRPVGGEIAALAVGNPPENSYDGPGFKLLGAGDYLIQDLIFRRRPGHFGGLGILTGPNNIRGFGEYSSVTIERTRFEGLRFGVLTMPSSAPSPRVDILASEFTTDTPGDSIGTTANVYMIDNADYVEQTSPVVTVRGTRFVGTPDAPTQGIWSANGVFAATGLPTTTVSLLVEDNEFSYCSRCLWLMAATDQVVVRGNTFAAPGLPATGSSTAIDVSPLGSPTIENNVFMGQPATGGYTFAVGIDVSGTAASTAQSGVFVSDNTLSGANIGVDVDTSFPGTLTGTDNVIGDVSTVIRKQGTSTLSITASDFGPYTLAWDGDLGDGSLVCNWWGDAAGPGPSVTDADRVASPWADGPIANGGTGTCN